MRLESEHTHYRTRFELFAQGSHDDIGPFVLQVLYNWLRGKELKRRKDGEASWLLKRIEETTFNYHAEYPESVSTGCYTSRALLEGTSIPASYEGGMGSGEDSKLRSICLREGDETFPRYWAMDYDEPDGTIELRRWHTSVGVVSRGESCVVNVRITNYLLPQYVGNPPRQPTSTTPNFVRELVTLRGTRATMGNSVVTQSVVKLGLHNWEPFLVNLVGKGRELPIILVVTDRDGRAPVRLKDLAYKVLGMARVFLVDYSDYESRKLLQRTFVEGAPSWEHRVGPSYVRVYKPNVNLKSRTDANRHRWFDSSDIERYGNSFNDMLTRSLTRGWVQDEDDIVDVLDVETRERRARNAELRRRLDELSRSTRRRSDDERRWERDREAEASIAELRKMLEERDLAIDELEQKGTEWQEIAEAFARDLDRATATLNRERKSARAQSAGYDSEIAEKDSRISELDDKVNYLEYQLKATWEQSGELSAKLKAAESALVAYEGIAHVPDKLSELLEVLCVLYPDRVCILDEARKSALAFDGRYDLDDEWAILRSIPTVLWELYFDGDPSTNIQQDYQALTSFELALTEGSMTNKGAKYMKQRERTYRGETISIAPHIKGRSGNPKDNFRLHYYADTERKVIVIGHCGAHLETAGSKKLS